jgi:hypothetical protein
MPASVVLCGLAACTLIGCAGAPPPPNEAARSAIKSIAVVSPAVGALVHESRLPPDPGSSALLGSARGALAGAGEGMRISLSPGSGAAGVVVALALIPVGAAVGAIIGAANAAPPAELEFVGAELGRLARADEIRSALQAHVAKAARNLQSRPVVAPPPEETGAASIPPNYRGLAERGVDTVVEVRLRSYGIAADKGRNPLLVPYIIAEVRLVRAADGTELYAREFRRVGSVQRLAHWRTAGPGVLAQELDRTSAALGESIVEELFLVWRGR